jgi:hypothetical protein
MTSLFSMKALNILNEMAFERLKAVSTMPAHCIPKPKFSDSSANNLTKSIIKYIELMGYQAERISNTGRYVDNTKKFKNIQGQTMQVGSGQYIPGTGTNGTADISATIKGKSVKIEVKYGKDRQSEAQKDYQLTIERSGGIYYIAKDFETFYNFYQTL